MSEGPQTITRKGRTAAVVVGAEVWQRKTNRVGNLAEFFAEYLSGSTTQRFFASCGAAAFAPRVFQGPDVVAGCPGLMSNSG